MVLCAPPSLAIALCAGRRSDAALLGRAASSAPTWPSACCGTGTSTSGRWTGRSVAGVLQAGGVAVLRRRRRRRPPATDRRGGGLPRRGVQPRRGHGRDGGLILEQGRDDVEMLRIDGGCEILAVVCDAHKQEVGARSGGTCLMSACPYSRAWAIIFGVAVVTHEVDQLVVHDHGAIGSGLGNA